VTFGVWRVGQVGQGINFLTQACHSISHEIGVERVAFKKRLGFAST
jgi:hypothetical protein